MAKIGKTQKFSTLKQQRESAELELIIDEFGLAMRNANRAYIAALGTRAYGPHLTMNMRTAWDKYVAFCVDHQ